MIRAGYAVIGVLALLLGAVGVALPLLPTTPFLILAAFCFARSNPSFERWLLESPTFGSAIRDWRERGAISRKGKRAAVAMLAASAVAGALLLSWPLASLPTAAALLAGSWILTRPER